MTKKAFFRFEASPTVGAGHAIRSCVIADALLEEGWTCYLVTSRDSYDFIPDLQRFTRVNPDEFHAQPTVHDLLVVDHYDLDETYEKRFRGHAQQIMAIDDLANRKHHCDILLDQTYGRQEKDYKDLVPKNCKILTGSDYVLLRKAFREMRPKALEKRRGTKDIQRILVSMGGGDGERFTLKALEMIQEVGFKGDIDIVLGFQDKGRSTILEFLETMPNAHRIHVNGNMAQLMYEADLCIGAAGSSVWERCCLGLPTFMIVLSQDQELIASHLHHANAGINFGLIDSIHETNAGNQIRHMINSKNMEKLCLNASQICDGLGINRLGKELHVY